MVLGCKTDRRFDGGNVNDDVPFGLCMEGWLQYISMISSNDRIADMSQDAGHDQVVAFTEDGGVFSNVKLRTADPTIAMFGENKPTDTNVFSWDSSLPTDQLDANGWYIKEAVTAPFY